MTQESSNTSSQKTNSSELSVVEQQLPTSFLSNKNTFEHVQRVAGMFAKSDMVPKRYQHNVGNCVIALEMAHRMGISALMVMQHLDIIQGKPGWSSVFLIASLNASGKFSPLRYEEDDKEGGRTRAWAMDKMTNEKVYGVWVSMKMATDEGWSQKTGSKWKTMPGLMIRYRAASFFVKQFAPEISMGFQTSEELYDITPAQTVDTPHSDVDKERERLQEMIRTATKPDELEALSIHIDANDKTTNDLYDEKMNELKSKK